MAILYRILRALATRRTWQAAQNVLHCRRGEQYAHTGTSAGDPPLSGAGLPRGLLPAVRLAAQCTDERVNQVTPALYARFPTLEAFAAAEPEDVEPYVHSCGFYRAKARDIVLCARKLVAEYGGRVPDTMEALTSLPGVGRKTANLILGDVYHKPAVRKILTPEESSDFCHRLVLHGRAVCTACKPMCGRCCVRHVCQTAEEMEL